MIQVAVGGGGLWWRLCPVAQPLTLLYTILDRKGTPFIYF